MWVTVNLKGKENAKSKDGEGSAESVAPVAPARGIPTSIIVTVAAVLLIAIAVVLIFTVMNGTIGG